MTTTEELRKLFLGVAAGRFPPQDGGVTVLSGPLAGPSAVLGYTGHHVIAADVDPGAIRDRLDPSDLGAPLKADFLHWLGHQAGRVPATLDQVFMAGAVPQVTIALETTGTDHPRVRRAKRHRDRAVAWSDPDRRGVLVIGEGLGGRLEMSFEIDGPHRGRGLGRAFARSARGLIPAGSVIFAQAAVGNAASVRALLGAGFRPIGAEVLLV